MKICWASENICWARAFPIYLPWGNWIEKIFFWSWFLCMVCVFVCKIDYFKLLVFKKTEKMFFNHFANLFYRFRHDKYFFHSSLLVQVSINWKKHEIVFWMLMTYQSGLLTCVFSLNCRYMITKTLKERNLKSAVIKIPINGTGVAPHLLHQPPWTLWWQEQSLGTRSQQQQSSSRCPMSRIYNIDCNNGWCHLAMK